MSIVICNLQKLHALRTSFTNGDFAILSHALVLSKIGIALAVLYVVEDKQLKKFQPFDRSHISTKRQI
jgi:hypothetical protein